MEVISNVALISINETLWVQLISFLIFMFILNRIMIRPLRSVMAERRQLLVQMQEDIAHSEAEYERVTEEIRSEEHQIRRDAQKMGSALEAEGSQDAAEIFADVRATITRQREKAQQEIDAKIASARQSVAQEANLLADRIMEKILDRRLG